MRQAVSLLRLTALLLAAASPAWTQQVQRNDACEAKAGTMLLAGSNRALPIYVAPQDSETLNLVAEAFAKDVERVTGLRPRVIHTLDGESAAILLGTLGHSPAIDSLALSGGIDAAPVRGKWESAVTAVVDHPTPSLRRALVIAGSDRRGAAYALFSLSREIGVSPWSWWADVPVQQQKTVCVTPGSRVQGEPSVRYRGIFLNDEDWGLRPWAARKMDPELNNIGPHTYRQVFELLLRLRANLLWPAMHPGTLAFNALPDAARLADRWGIVMGSSHSEAMLRNNVSEWKIPRDGPWNYQTNRKSIDAYWNRRVLENGRYENVYTVGLRGLHDSGLEATGSDADKARLVESALASQRAILAADVDANVERIPQVLWLYKESLQLYRAGMKVPNDVTLGWTDDNYGYIRQMPTAAEQQRSGGSAIYYHISYWGFPHDYLWLCTTPPALIREEMAKAFDHGARRMWVLNAGDLKPAEQDIDYFMQLAWDEPAMARTSQSEFLQRWYGEQFGEAVASRIASMVGDAARLNFIRKPEFMGFNGYNDEVGLTAFNPLAWGDQNRVRTEAWQNLSQRVDALAAEIPAPSQSAFYELVAYPIQAAAALNEKFLFTDRSYLNAFSHRLDLAYENHNRVVEAYARIQSMTRAYNLLEGGKWEGMMDFAPRARQVFYRPVTGIDAGSGGEHLGADWGAAPEGATVECDRQMRQRSVFRQEDATVSINAAHYVRKQDSAASRWHVLDDLGISGASLVFGDPGKTPPFEAMQYDLETLDKAPWVEYEFNSNAAISATLTLHLLPVFPVDAEHHLRLAVSLDGQPPHLLDQSGSGEWKEGSAPAWENNVLRNDARIAVELGSMTAGRHTLRFFYVDPGVVLQHLAIAFPEAPPAYPVPPETRCKP